MQRRSFIAAAAGFFGLWRWVKAAPVEFEQRAFDESVGELAVGIRSAFVNAARKGG